MQFFRFSCLAAVVVAGSFAASQQPVQQPSSSAALAVDNDFVQKQFGDSCSLMNGSGPLKADLDGDGVEDIVIVARCRNPLPDQAEFKFTVIDPYDAFYGFGDVKITSAFASEDPASRGVALLIIHGAGPEAWRSATPKAKFLIVNLPFKTLMVKKLALRKKVVIAIYAEEAHEGEGTVSAIYWDGRKYKYQPVGTSME